MLRELNTWLVSTLLAPRSSDEDQRRREFVLNVILLSSITLSAVAIILATGNFLTKGVEYNGNHPLFILIILTVFVGLYRLARTGYFVEVSYALVTLYTVTTFYAIYRWSLYIPQAPLSLSIVIIMSGILLGSQFAFFLTAGICVALLVLTYLQSQALLPVDASWTRTLEPQITDAVVFAFSLMTIMVLSWLFNHEMKKALRRAKASEAALKKQRDKLEVLVEKRTRELKRIQAEKITQLYRFAELGKSTSGLFHDLVTPLTLISLNLHKLGKEIGKPELANTRLALERALIGTKRMESFVQAARRQVQNQETVKKFSVREEIHHVIQLFSSKARKNRVQIMFVCKENPKLTGNPVKFNQIITNFLTNAIDAYDGLTRKKKVVEVRVEKGKDMLHIYFQDWGSGIEPRILPHIFELLFTTKDPDRGTGIGLSVAKEIIEKDFKGRCSVTSKKGEGTTFKVDLPLA